MKGGLSVAAVLAWLASGAAAQPATEPLAATTAAGTPEYTLLRMHALMQPDTTIVEPAEQQRNLVDHLREIPALAAEFDARWPDNTYRPYAKSLLIDALLMLRKANDPAGSIGAIAAAAADLSRLKGAPQELLAKAQYTLLSVEMESIGPTTRPAGATGPASAAASSRASASAPASEDAALCQLAGKFIALAEDYRKTAFAPLSMYAAAGLYIQAGRRPQAQDLLERLAAEFPRNSVTYDGLLLLARLYTDAGQRDKANAAKRKLVAEFPDTSAALRYRCDIAQAECLGKEFHLRFQAMDGTRFNIRDHRGKRVLVYFFFSAADEAGAKAVAADLAQLAKLDGGEAVLVAVGADDQRDAAKVRGALAAAGVACPVLLDDQRQVANQYGVMVAPSVAMVDKEGRLAAIVPGPDVAKALRARLGETSASQP